jgi:fructose-1,6-bisphosphatase/inositol monophosphatase family enzyme
MVFSASSRELAAFSVELRALTAALDPGADWYAVFARRTPTELDDWLAGLELPPWDVVADLLQDLAGLHGPAAAAERERRLRERYAAAVRAQDALPGAHAELTRRSGLLERAGRDVESQVHRLAAAERSARMAGRIREADRLAALRVWTEDDAARVRARHGELRARLAGLPPPAPVETVARQHRQAESRQPEGGQPEGGPPPAARPRGARFAGLEEGPPRPAPVVPDEEDRRTVNQLIGRLGLLRDQGRRGAVHAALCEALGGPPQRLPLLVAGMERAGLGAETATLLWEAAALPPGPVAGIARALADAGQGRHCGQLLRQGAARPAAEAGTIAADLISAGRARGGDRRRAGQTVGDSLAAGRRPAGLAGPPPGGHRRAAPCRRGVGPLRSPRRSGGGTAAGAAARTCFDGDMIDEQLAVAAEDAVRRAAAEEIMPRWRQLAADEVSAKSGPHDLVTIADRRAEQHLSASLTALLPGSVVVGEEGVHEDPARYEALHGDAPVWIVDPVDGTRQFVRGEPGFCTLVALALHGEVLASWTYAPARGLMATARRGEGARLNGKPITAGSPAGNPLEVACSHPDFTTEDQKQALAGLWTDGVDPRPCGSAGLEYLRIARGQLDAVAFSWELAWDHAAGLLLVCEAGGTHRTLAGLPFKITGNNTLPFTAARDEETARRILGLLAAGAPGARLT